MSELLIYLFVLALLLSFGYIFPIHYSNITFWFRWAPAFRCRESFFLFVCFYYFNAEWLLNCKSKFYCLCLFLFTCQGWVRKDSISDSTTQWNAPPRFPQVRIFSHLVSLCFTASHIAGLNYDHIVLCHQIQNLNNFQISRKLYKWISAF